MFTFIRIADSWIYFYHFILFFIYHIYYYFFLLPIGLILPSSQTQCFERCIFSSLRGHAYILNIPHNLRKIEVISSSSLSSPVLCSLLVSPVFLNLPKLAFIIRVVDYPIPSTSLSLWNSEPIQRKEWEESQE